MQLKREPISQNIDQKNISWLKQRQKVPDTKKSIGNIHIIWVLEIEMEKNGSEAVFE